MNFHIEPADLIEQFDAIIKKHNFFLKDAASSYVPTLSNGHLEIRLSVDRTIVELFLVIDKESVELEHLFIFLYPDKNLDEEKKIIMKDIQVDNFISRQIRCYAELIQKKMPFILEPTWEIPRQYIKRRSLYKEVNDLVMAKYFHVLDLRLASNRADIDVAIKEMQQKGVEIPADILDILDKFEHDQQ